jgi:antitoxin component YwqK of YwqJK toxin-antitoxin module
MTSSIRTHADGTFDYAYSLAADGSKTTDKYNSAGLLLSETILRADGSSDLKTYANGVIANETVKYTSGAVASIVSTYAGGTIANAVIKYATGSTDAFEIKTYTNGVLTKDDIVHADNSEDIYSYNVQNKDYVAAHDTYNSARVLTSSVHTHADGTLAYSYTLAADGTKTTDVYDAAGNLVSDTVVRTNGFSDVKTYSKGVLTGETVKFAPGGPDLSEAKIYTAGTLTSDTIVHADKSKDIYLSGIQSKSYVAEHDVYNSAGVLTSVTRTHSDGSLDYTYNLASDGTKITDQYNAAGALISDSVVRTSGWSEVKTYANGVLSSDVVRYAPGSADLVDAKTYAAGTLTNETIVHASKARDVFDWNVTGKSYVADHLVYDSFGRTATADFTNLDGSHGQTAYLSGVSLTSTTGVSDTLTAASTGGDSFLFKPNSGNDTIVGFHAGNAANHDTIVLDSWVVSDFSHLVMQQVGRDTLITLDAHDSILVKNVLPSALTSADFHFVHDWTLS